MKLTLLDIGTHSHITYGAMLIDRQKQTAACDMTPVDDLLTLLQPHCLLEQVPTPSVNPFINLAPTQIPVKNLRKSQNHKGCLHFSTHQK